MDGFYLPKKTVPVENTSFIKPLNGWSFYASAKQMP